MTHILCTHHSNDEKSQYQYQRHETKHVHGSNRKIPSHIQLGELIHHCHVCKRQEPHSHGTLENIWGNVLSLQQNHAALRRQRDLHQEIHP